MRAGNDLIVGGSHLSFFFGRLRAFFSRHPQWWAWGLCLSVWALLAINSFTATGERNHFSYPIYCIGPGTVQASAPPIHEIQNGLKEQGIFSRIPATISKGLVHWSIMVVAMMFLLLNTPIRHVAFSVRRKDRPLGIFWFLIGYTITWTVAGMLFLLLPLLLDMLIGDRSPLINGLIKASGFLFAAAWIWSPARSVRMAKCDRTMPIRIQGPQLHLDSLTYGVKMGHACLGMCWAPMAALMLADHTLVLMYAVTIVLIYERYLLPHTSKLPGYAWGAIALTLFGIEMWA